MRQAKYVAMDFETGGTDPLTSSALSVAFVFYDESFEELDYLDFALWPKDGTLRRKQ